MAGVGPGRVVLANAAVAVQAGGGAVAQAVVGIAVADVTSLQAKIKWMFFLFPRLPNPPTYVDSHQEGFLCRIHQLNP